MRPNAETGGSGAFVPDMHTEPALTIGDIFASKTMIKTYVAAAIGLVATIFHFVVDDNTVEQITLLVELVAFAATAYMAQREARRRALDQAQITRDAVYSPASVNEITKQELPRLPIENLHPSEWGKVSPNKR